MATDKWLSEVYGTNGTGGDIEKTAQAMMLHKLAEEEGIDLSGLDEEQLDALAQAVVSQDGEEGEGYEGGDEGGDEGGGTEQPGVEDEAQAKFAEADFLGRVMAHAYTQELNKIAEEAAAEEAAEGKKHEEEEKKGLPPAFAAKAEKKEEEAEKTAGPIARAIRSLGGSVDGGAAEYVEKLAEARAIEILRANGYNI